MAASRSRVTGKDLRQTVSFRATPRMVYEALIRSKEHATFTADKAKFDAKPGGRFEAYGGSLSGFVLELEKDRRITLAWRSSEWPKGHYSLAIFRISPRKGGSRLDFEQYGIPADDFADIRQGWIDYYWTPLATYLDG